MAYWENLLCPTRVEGVKRLKPDCDSIHVPLKKRSVSVPIVSDSLETSSPAIHSSSFNVLTLSLDMSSPFNIETTVCDKTPPHTPPSSPSALAITTTILDPILSHCFYCKSMIEADDTKFNSFYGVNICIECALVHSELVTLPEAVEYFSLTEHDLPPGKNSLAHYDLESVVLACERKYGNIYNLVDLRSEALEALFFIDY